MVEGITEFMQVTQLFFNGWFLLLGTIIGLPLGGATALLWAPMVWRAKRRHALRLAWLKDQPRELPTHSLPYWAEYDPEGESVDSRCVCHKRRIAPGERVLLWPEVSAMGIAYTAVYCESLKGRV